MPFSDELILQQLTELNAALKRIEEVLTIGSKNTASSDSLSKFPHPYCDAKTASELTGLSPEWFANKRWSGGGPPYIKMGNGKRGAVRYKVADLIGWFEQNKVQNTSQSPTQQVRMGKKSKLDVNF